MALLFFAVETFAASDKDTFQVIVHKENKTERLTQSQVSAIFLGKKNTWAPGIVVKPVDLPVDNATRKAFSRKVHKKSAKEVDRLWRRRMIQGYSPPAQASDDGEVTTLVGASAGGIGYVKRGFTSADSADVRVLEVAKDPVLKKKVEPHYTPMARQAKTRGIVVLKVVIRENGSVGSVIPIRSLGNGLTGEAERAVRKWRYEPAKVDGKPVSVTLEIPISFRP